MRGISKTDRDLWDAGDVTGHLVPAGSVFAFLVVMAAGMVIRRDYTERRRAEHALRESETLLSQFMENLPIGVIVTVQPSINRETEEISLALRPTVTRVVDVVDDPAVAIASNNTVVSQIPVVAVQEIDSVGTMHSGQGGVVGGLTGVVWPGRACAAGVGRVRPGRAWCGPALSRPPRTVAAGAGPSARATPRQAVVVRGFRQARGSWARN